MSINGAPVMAASVVAVDVGKNMAALSATDADRRRLFGPVDFAMTAPAFAAVLERVCAVLPAAAVTVGIEAAGHYHRPLLGASVWPAGWQVLELSPARVAEQRRVQGRRRVKTDVIDLEAITELVLAGHGVPVTAAAAAVTELIGWAASPTSGADADGDEEPVAGPAGPLFSRVEVSPARCVGHSGQRSIGPCDEASQAWSTAAKYSNGAAARRSSTGLVGFQRASVRLTDGQAITLQARG